MKFTVKTLLAVALPALFLALGTAPCAAVATLTQQVDAQEVHVGDNVVVTYTVQNGDGPSVQLPAVDGLQLNGTRSATSMTLANGSLSSIFTESFNLIPTHAGDITIPAFDIHNSNGQVLHTQAIKLHVQGGSTANIPPPPVPAQQPLNFPSNPNGPVVMPPNGGAPNNSTSGNVNVPVESTGRPAKVFIVITPQTTDTYVGESIPLQIDFFIRMDVASQQNSLPTIKGSDFLMNDLSVHPQEDLLSIMNETFHRERWVTAITAPKSGDYPLEMERDTYWLKTSPTNNNDIFSSFFRHATLAHEPIASNKLTIHVHELPMQGRPANFTGAIGQFKITATAQPASVAVGEPASIQFLVSGAGNFDYVRCPVLAEDPAWKFYIPSSKIDYQDQSHTQAVKTFEQAAIPQKNGSVPLPSASFSYFDPATKKYVTVPVTLPAITVTGTAAPLAAAPANDAANAATTPVEPAATDFIPNRLVIGSLYTNLTPAYRHLWFWIVQGGLIVALIAGALFVFLRSDSDSREKERAEQRCSLRSLNQEEDAMSQAVRSDDALAFFIAARHAVQLQLGARWKLKPETLTLAEIRQRDPQLAETLEPLFTQADQIIYSGQASTGLDLAQWELRVREELLQPA